MNKFSHEEGLTLIELLITLAVIAIVFAIAVPVFSNVLAGAQASAAAAQASGLAAFHDEYASTTLAYANGVTTATLNGVVIASIKGDATGGSAPAAATYSAAFNSTDAEWGPSGWDINQSFSVANLPAADVTVTSYDPATHVAVFHVEGPRAYWGQYGTLLTIAPMVNGVMDLSGGENALLSSANGDFTVEVGGTGMNITVDLDQVTTVSGMPWDGNLSSISIVPLFDNSGNGDWVPMTDGGFTIAG